MLKTFGSIKSTTRLRKSKIEVDGDHKAERDSRCKFDGEKIDSNEDRNNKDNEIRKKCQKRLSPKICPSSKA